MEPDVDSPEAARTRAIASKLLAARDLVGSKSFAERALSADPDVPDERADQILAIADVLLASQNHRVNDHLDWYSLLQLPHPNPNPNPNPNANDFSPLLKRHYRRLALLLHPDRNKFPGADSAFELVIDAYNFLSDPAKKLLFDAELLRISDSLPPPPDGTTFWTICPSCCHVHQYPRAHQGKPLRCRTCRHGFDAVEMQAPPSVVPGTNTYQSSWGFFPLGFPTSMNSEWKPFVPMFPWTPGGVGGAGPQEPQLPAKQVNAAPPPPSGKGTKKMARKKVGSGLKKKLLASEILHARTAGGAGFGVGGSGVGDVSLEKEAVAAKGIDMNEKAKDSEEAGEDDGFELLIDMDVTNDLLGNLQNLPFLRDEVTNIQIP